MAGHLHRQQAAVAKQIVSFRERKSGGQRALWRILVHGQGTCSEILRQQSRKKSGPERLDGAKAVYRLV
ncbi:hypothetical protein D3C75_1107560 [compost metagenome]